MKHSLIDNSRPDDPNYPTAPEREDLGKDICVDIGDYIVNRDGDIMIATTSNRKWFGDDSPVASWNIGFFRAKYIGNKDDSLEYANQSRIAFEGEIQRAKEYKQTGYKVASDGQGVLL